MRHASALLLAGVCAGGLALLWMDRAPRAATSSSPAPSTAAAMMFEPPGRDAYPAITGDTATLVNGRRVTPAGRVIRTMSYAWALTLDPAQRRAAVVTERSIELVGLGEPVTRTRYPSLAGKTPSEEDKKTFGSGTYMGALFSPDGTRLYFGSANDGEIKALDLASGRVDTIADLDVDGFEDSYAGDFALSRDGKRLFVRDQFNYRLAIIDVAAGRVVRNVRVGRNPFAIALSPDERIAWVTNVGMFEYPLLPAVCIRARSCRGRSRSCRCRTRRRCAGIRSRSSRTRT